MVTVLKNDQGLVYAYLDWYVVDGEGQQNSKGSFLFVDGIWIHEVHRNFKTMKKLWRETLVREDMKRVTDVYWTNLKHNRQVYLKPKERFLRGSA